MDYVDDIDPVLVIEELFFKAAVGRNYDPYFNGLSFCASISAPKLPLNSASILLFLTAASCVLLYE